MARDIDRLIEIVRDDESLGMGPVLRQALISRIEHPPTEKELARARAEVLGRSPASV